MHAIFIAILALNNSITLSKIKMNDFNNIVNVITEKMLKNIEKCANFLLSLFEEISVNSGSKLVPIFAPNINGMAWYNEIKPDRAKIWIIAINTLEDCRALVNKIPIIILKK